jgi:hypothetical protein
VLGFVLFGSSIVWMGYALWSGTTNADAVTRPAQPRATAHLAAEPR